MTTNNSINSQDPIQVSKGGTGLNTVAQGDLLIASASNTLASLPKNTTATRYLSNTGVNNAPAYAQVDLSNGVTGTLPIANGGTGQSTLTTANGILAAGTTATGAIQNIGTGSAGQVLTSNGTSLPSFQAAGSGDYVLLKTDSPSGAASVIYDNTYITTTYKTYVVIFNDVDSTGLELFVSDDNGATYKTTGYTSGFFSLAYNNTSIGNNNSTTAGLVTNSGVTNFSANMMIYNLQSAQRTCWSGMGWCLNSFWMTIAGENSTTNINNIKFQPNSGNITNGSFKLYGLK